MTLGNRVRELRKALGLSQEKLAERIGVDRSYIAHIESGRTKMPSADVITALARALETTSEDLFRAMVGPPPTTEEDIDLEDPALNLQLKLAAKELSPEGRRSLLDYVRFVREQERRERESRKPPNR